MYTKEVDLCFRINKIEPLKKLKKELGVSVWLSAVRRDQNKNRSRFSTFMLDKSGYIRVHPLIYWDREKIWQYIYSHKLPYHPLYDKGYTSIGCFPPVCTMENMSNGDERRGRWINTDKRECGLHLDLVKEEEEAWAHQLELKETKNE